MAYHQETTYGSGTYDPPTTGRRRRYGGGGCSAAVFAGQSAYDYVGAGTGAVRGTYLCGSSTCQIDTYKEMQRRTGPFE